MAFVFNPGPPKEAYTFWKDKVPMGRKAFNALSEEDRVRAFIVGGMAKGDMLTAMYQSIDKALAGGQGLKSWKKEIRTLFNEKGWNQLRSWRLDNIYRTNIQTAYSVGRYRQMMEVADTRPWWRYSAINDSRTRMSHAALHGRVVRCDDPFWDVFFPPNGYRCRCAVTCLSDRDMARKGYTAETIKKGQILEIPDGPQKGRAVPVMPDNNFQTNPGKFYWQADLGRFRTDVKQAVLKDIAVKAGNGLEAYNILKHHLSQEHLEELETVMWADGEKARAGFGKWVDNVLEAGRSKGEIYPVGNLPARVLKALAAPPRLALVTIDDTQLLHMSRSAKAERGAALTPDEIKEIPDRLQTGQWWRDNENKNYLMTWIRQKDAWLKVVVNMDHRIGNSKKRIANHIITAGVVQEKNIVGNQRYEEI